MKFERYSNTKYENKSTDTINDSKKYKSLCPNVIYGLLSLCLSQSHTSSLKPHFNSRIPHFERLGIGAITTDLILFLPFLPLLLYHFQIKPENRSVTL